MYIVTATSPAIGSTARDLLYISIVLQADDVVEQAISIFILVIPILEVGSVNAAMCLLRLVLGRPRR